VADDQESMRVIIAGMLKENGHEIVTAEDGRQALELFTQDHFDLVVADVNMPKLDGLEFLKAARQIKPNAKIVFVTGMLEDTVKIGSESLGLNGLILKPFEKKDALATLEKVLAL